MNLSCGGSTAAPPKAVPPAGTWARLLASEFGRGKSYNDAWGVSINDAWSVGGTIDHYDGKTWSTAYTPKSLSSSIPSGFSSIHGTATDDVWAVGGKTVGAPALLVHWDGKAWTEAASPPGPTVLRAVWCNSRTDAWAAGEDHAGTGYMLHYDGTSWTVIDSVASEVAYLDVWASGPNDVYATSTIAVKHFDGSTWTELAIDRDDDLAFTGVHGTAANDVWIVGTTDRSKGEVFHFNGTSLSRVYDNPDVQVGRVWTDTGGHPWISVFEVLPPRGTNTDPRILYGDGRGWVTFAAEGGFISRLGTVKGVGTSMWLTNELGIGSFTPQ